MLERTQIVDVAQIYQLGNDYAAAINDGDLERWLSLWLDDAVWISPGAPSCVGKEQIRKEMQLLLDHFHISNMIIQTEEVRILVDRAYAHGTYTFEMTPRERGETTCYAGKFLDILEKQSDGSWKIAIDCHNLNSLC